MRRREFITLLSSAAVAWPLAARAQQAAMPVLGYLDSGSPEASQGILPSLRRGLADAGYIAGKTITSEARWANGQVERLPALAKDLVDRRVDIIVAAGAVSSARAAKAATSTIPVVIAGGADPGLVDSLPRPGGNITGVTLIHGELASKRLDLMHALVTFATRSLQLPDDIANAQASRCPARDAELARVYARHRSRGRLGIRDLLSGNARRNRPRVAPKPLSLWRAFLADGIGSGGPDEGA